MPNMRVMPPGDTGRTSLAVNGRSYSCAAGSTIDVPDFDAAELVANGWSAVAGSTVGTTAQRPTSPAKNQVFIDTTVGAAVVWDGKAWRHHVSGAAA